MTGYKPMVWYSNTSLQGTSIHNLLEIDSVSINNMLKIVGDIPKINSFFYFKVGDNIYIITN